MKLPHLNHPLYQTAFHVISLNERQAEKKRQLEAHRRATVLSILYNVIPRQKDMKARSDKVEQATDEVLAIFKEDK